jgi:hypothetical protein
MPVQFANSEENDWLGINQMLCTQVMLFLIRAQFAIVKMDGILRSKQDPASLHIPNPTQVQVQITNLDLQDRLLTHSGMAMLLHGFIWLSC